MQFRTVTIALLETDYYCQCLRDSFSSCQFCSCSLPQYTPPPIPISRLNTQVENLAQSNKHFLVFDQIGHMAASTTYIHAIIPIKLSTIAAQAQPLFQQFSKMQSLKTKNLTHILFCKNMKEMGQVFERRLLENLKHLKDLDDVLPTDSPSLKSGKTKRVPIAALIPLITGATWFIKTLAIAKPLAGVISFATVVGTAAHLITQSNFNTELNLQQYRDNLIAMNETKQRELELDDLLKQYRKRLETTRAPLTMTPHQDILDNERAVRDLHDSIREAEKIIPDSYREYFNFDTMIPKPPPVGWKEHPALIKAYTDDLRAVNSEIRKQVDTLKENPYITKTTQVRLTRDSPVTELDVFMDFFLSLTAWDHQPISFPPPTEGKTEEFVSRVDIDDRNKRSAAVNWGALASIVAGTFLGMYSTVEVGLIKAKLSNLEKAHNMLVHLTAQHDLQMQELTQDLDLLRNSIELMLTYDSGILYARLDRVLTQWEGRVTKIVNALQQAQNRRLSIDLLSSNQLNLLHQSTLELAASNNLQLLPQRPTDYLQLEVSYARSGQDILLIAHVPCVSAENLLTVYKFIPFPFPLPKSAPQSQLSIRHSLFPSSATDDNVLPDLDPSKAKYPSSSQALYLDMDTDMIAINKENQYRSLTEADVASCIQRNHVFLCEKSNVLRTDLRDTCLGALYFRSAEGVKSHCRFERKALREEVYQTGPFTFLVFSPGTFTTKVECTNGTMTPIFLGQVTRLTIPPHCHATLQTHILRPTEHYKLDTKSVITEWEWDPLDLPADLLTNGPHLDISLHRLSASLNNLKTADKDLKSATLNLRTETKSAYTQLSQDATLDSEFESVLIKQMQTVSISAIVFWFCFSVAILGCFGSTGFYLYYYCTTRKYPSLVDALESMQQLLPPDEISEPPIKPTRTYVTEHRPHHNRRISTKSN
jgi:hypothetical protein